jgi:anti-sigma factor RsiW
MNDAIQPEDDELIRKEIDGEITPAEREMLDRRMAEQPLLRARHGSVQRLVAALARVGLVNPPAGFAAAVLRAARARDTAGVGWAGAIRSVFQRRPAFGLALALAAGLVVGAVGVGLIEAPRLDSYAAATALTGQRLQQAPTLDRQRLAIAGVEAEASTRRTDVGIEAEVRISAGGPVDLSVEFDAGHVRAVAVEREPANAGTVTIDANELRVSGAGPGVYRLILASAEPATPPLRVRITSPAGRLEKMLGTK